MSAVVREPRLVIRKMRLQDLDEVYANETAAYTHPWTRGILHDCLRVGYQCVLVEWDEQVVGHAVLSAAAGEAHLLNLCVAPALQGQGIGRRLLRRMLKLAAQQGADTLFLEVRSSNLAAQRLYESEGFCEIGQRYDYYPAEGQQREDAHLYARPLD